MPAFNVDELKQQIQDIANHIDDTKLIYTMRQWRKRGWAISPRMKVIIACCKVLGAITTEAVDEFYPKKGIDPHRVTRTLLHTLGDWKILILTRRNVEKPRCSIWVLNPAFDKLMFGDKNADA